MRKIGDRVFVTADNYGGMATIIEIRESTGKPASCYKVQTDCGDQMFSQEFWAFDFEISEPIDAAAVQRVHNLFMTKLAAAFPDHPWLRRKD